MNKQGIGGMPGQIISELGQIAKDVGKQTAQIPKDIAGKALESLGASGTKTPGGTVKVQTNSPDMAPKTAWDKIAVEKDQKVKQAIARRALEELAGGQIQKKREPSIWERLQAEQEQKKQMMSQQTGPGGMSAPLQKSSSKRPVGDLYGAKAKKTATENRNIRQD